MLGLLLVSAMLAWWLVEARGGRHDEAVDILEHMRAGGLAEYAGKLPSHRYMIGYVDEEPAAWRIDIRAGGSDGIGGRTFLRVDGGTLIHARWALSAEATEGTYVAERDGPDGNTVTHIRLEGGRIAVREQRGRALRVAEAQTPVNYVPEGGLPFVISAIVRRGTTATFASLIDGHTVLQGQVQFVSLVVSHRSDRRVEVTYAGQVSRTFVLDDAGHVKAIETAEGVTFRRVGRQELIDAFPEAGRLLPEDDPAPEAQARQPTPATVLRGSPA